MNISSIASSMVNPVRSLDRADTAKSATPADTEAAERRKVAGQFEAILVRQMLSKSVGSMLGGGDDVAGSVYGDMMTDTLAQNLTSGRGLGLGRMIEQQLTPRGKTVATGVPSHVKS